MAVEKLPAISIVSLDWLVAIQKGAISDRTHVRKDIAPIVPSCGVVSDISLVVGMKDEDVLLVSLGICPFCIGISQNVESCASSHIVRQSHLHWVVVIEAHPWRLLVWQPYYFDFIRLCLAQQPFEKCLRGCRKFVEISVSTERLIPRTFVSNIVEPTQRASIKSWPHLQPMNMRGNGNSLRRYSDSFYP